MKTAIRMALLSLVASSTLAAPTIDDVGDIDSFGRGVKYLGVKSSSAVYLEKDCTPDPQFPLEDGARCLVVPAPPASLTINESGIATLKLPGSSARSLLCFTFQPVGIVVFRNGTQTNQTAALTFRSTVSIQSDVLRNGQLINPDTGAPFAGKLDMALGLFSKSRTLPPAHQEQESFFGARVCTGGLITKRSLIEHYGLTSAQAMSFFARPLTLTFGLAGSARTVETASLAYGVRIYGDSQSEDGTWHRQAG